MWAAGQIIPHPNPFVKRFLKFFSTKKALRIGGLNSRKRGFPTRGGLLCSRHNPSFLQLNGTGPHLYSAHLHTVRSRSLSARSYTTLVGLGVSPLPRPLVSVIIIPYLNRFVKGFFEIFSFFSSPLRESRG